jgi:hypothetical protein
MEPKYLLMCEKCENGHLIIVKKKEKMILKTFVNFSNNWFDIPQQKYYWFSMLIYKDFCLNEIIYSNRADYYLNGEVITDINLLKKSLFEINEYIFANLKNIQTFVESELEYMYFESL